LFEAASLSGATSSSEAAPEIDCDVLLDEARRSSPEVAGSAARTPMVTAESVATTARGAATWTDRGMDF
jgi:hypothetical protein